MLSNVSFTKLILIEGGTLAFLKHYVNLNHYDTNINTFVYFYELCFNS